MIEYDPKLLESAELPSEHRYRLWAWMRQHAPVHYHAAGVWPAFWSVTRYEDVRRVYADPTTFSSQGGVLLRARAYGSDPAGGMTLALSDNDRHREFRALLAPHFDERRARTMHQTMLGDIRQALGPLRDGEVVDIAEDVGGVLSLRLICELLGVPRADVPQLHRWSRSVFEQGRSLTSSGEISRYLSNLIMERMEHPRTDALGSLVDGRVSGELLNETEILLNVENLLGASENAGLTISAGLHVLMQHPDQWTRVVASRALVPTAIEELMRYTTTAVHSARTATVDVTLGMARIRAGDRVVLWLPSANRDESVFREPNAFVADRGPNRHVSLGFGPHICIGANMARHQLRLLLDETADLAGRIEMCEPATDLSSVAVQGPARLRVRLGREAPRRADARL